MAIFIFSYFASALPLSKKTKILQVNWLDLVSIYQFAKYYQNISNGLSSMAIFADGQTDSHDDYTALFESQSFNRSIFFFCGSCKFSR